jgi:hypothetical protein
MNERDVSVVQILQALSTYRLARPAPRIDRVYRSAIYEADVSGRVLKVYVREGRIRR